MPTDYFQFKQFKVKHADSTMKVGTDAVLLGTLAKLPFSGKILEVGTGCGVVSLIIAQRCQSYITSIDIHQNSILEAKSNFEESPWNDKLSAQLISFQEFAKKEKQNRFELIISNPPFFQNDLKSPDANRNFARHNDNLSYSDFLSASRDLLSDFGNLSVILPAPESILFIDLAKEDGFHLHKKIEIKPKPDKAFNRAILIFGNYEKEIEIAVLSIRNSNNSYTEDYLKLTKDFYISLKP